MYTIMIILFIYSTLILAKLFFNNSIWEKVLIFNLFSAKFVLILLLYSVVSGLSYLIDIAFVYSLLGFVSIVLITRFIRKRGKI